jgi:hypothetical protein
VKVGASSAISWATLCVALEYVGLEYAALPYLMSRLDDQCERCPNLVGQGGLKPLLNALILVAVFYALKLTIIVRAKPGTAAKWYGLLLAASLPFIWLFVANQWHDDSAYNIGGVKLAAWIGEPIALLFVPTAAFCFHQSIHASLTMSRLALHTVIELLLLMPMWRLVWLWFMLAVLHWYWI